MKVFEGARGGFFGGRQTRDSVSVHFRGFIYKYGIYVATVSHEHHAMSHSKSGSGSDKQY